MLSFHKVDKLGGVHSDLLRTDADKEPRQIDWMTISRYVNIERITRYIR